MCRTIVSDELADAVDAFLSAQRRLIELTGGNTDAIQCPNGEAILLPPAQRRYLAEEAEKRRLAEAQAAVLDALPAHIALLDSSGRVALVNQAWKDFARANGYAGQDFGVGQNYLAACQSGSGEPDGTVQKTVDALRAVLAGRMHDFAVEYSCHGPDEKRWFQLQVAPMPAASGYAAVVMHINVTERKLAEIEASEVRRRLETFVREANIGILVHCGFKPVLANDALARMLGRAAARRRSCPFATAGSYMPTPGSRCHRPVPPGIPHSPPRRSSMRRRDATTTAPYSTSNSMSSPSPGATGRRSAPSRGT